MQPGLGNRYGNSFRSNVPLRASAEDFLGLEAELELRSPGADSSGHAAPPRPGAEAQSIQALFPYAPRERSGEPAAIPARELLPPSQPLSAHWPAVRPNTWRLGGGTAPSSPMDAGERPSWLLELDDSAIPPAHPAFVPTSAPANASFRDGTLVAHRVAPWFVRSLCVFAGLFLCAVITRTIQLRASRPPAAPETPVQPIARSAPSAGQGLLAPGEADAPLRAKPGAHPKPKAFMKAVGASAMGSEPAGSRSFLERDAPLDAGSTIPESPALVVYDLPAQNAPSAAPEAGAEFDRAGVDRWLAERSRASAPISDAGAIRAAEPRLPGAASQTSATATGIWEGATIPVEALSGGLRLQTPSVGRVRVRLEGGARTEGRLTAIGQGRVWIETDAGPVEVETAKMRGLEQIGEQSPAVAAPQAPKRQRVRTAGGVFFGRLLARDGRTVTLITDSGTRVTVEADEIGDADP